MTALFLLVSLAAPPATPTTEAVIENRTVDAWVADLRSEDYEKQRNAHAALTKAGPKAKDAVPALMKMLSEKNPQWALSAEILAEIGPDAKDAVPALLALLPKEAGFGYGAETIAQAVAKIDGPKIEATRALLLSSGKCQPILLTTSSTLYGYPEQVVTHLVTLCGDKDAVVRTKAATVLGTLKEKEVAKVPTKTLFERAGDGTKGVIPALEKLLTDDTKVRLAAANAITHVAPELAEKVISAVIVIATKEANRKTGEPHAAEIFRPISEQATKALIPLFDHEDDDLRWWAVNTLSSLPGAEQLEDALKNGKTARTREAAAITLGSRYREAAASIPALKAALADAEFVVRFAAAKALVHVGATGSDAGRAAVPVLVEGLQQNQEQTRLEASATLQSVGPTAKDAIPALKKLLTDNKLEVRLEAAFALVMIDAKDAGSVPALIEGLKASDSQATRAAKALAKLGPVAKEAVPELVKHFGGKNLHLRLYSAEAVAHIDAAQAPKAIEVLVALLQDKAPKMHSIHMHTISALQHIGSPAKAAMPTLAAMLTDDVSFRVEAAMAMIAIDPDGAKPAFEWMRAVLTKNGDKDAFDVADRLAELGAKAKPLIPELTKLLQSKTLYLRLHAVETLGAIGPDAKDALPELKKLAESDPRKNIRDLATEAIQKIEGK